jgi:hypothetical protein
MGFRTPKVEPIETGDLVQCHNGPGHGYVRGVNQFGNRFYEVLHLEEGHAILREVIIADPKGLSLWLKRTE